MAQMHGSLFLVVQHLSKVYNEMEARFIFDEDQEDVQKRKAGQTSNLPRRRGVLPRMRPPPRSAAQGCSTTRAALLAVSLCAALVLLSNQTHIQAELTSAAVHTHASVVRPDLPRDHPPPAAAESEERRRSPHQSVVEPSRSQPAPTPAPTPAPNPASTPTPAPTPAAARRPGLATFPPPPSSLTLVFGNSEMADFVYNWLAHARRVPGLAPYSAVALDDGLVAKCAALCRAAAHPEASQPPAQRLHGRSPRGATAAQSLRPARPPVGSAARPASASWFCSARASSG